MGTIIKPLTEIGLEDVKLGLAHIQATIDVASIRIESGNDAAIEIKYAQKYAISGLRALIN
jgi:hypothetical protein